MLRDDPLTLRKRHVQRSRCSLKDDLVMYRGPTVGSLMFVDVSGEYNPGTISEPRTAHGHRRLAAVLFADLTGFTELVEAVEPEIVYQVVRPLMDDLVAITQRHGGEIQQVLGDGFMCVFGLHETVGDEAERAVRAGLALVRAGGSEMVRPSVHAGLEYGEVFVTPSWPPAGYGVWGRAVNLAARLCALAGPGELQIGPRAYGHTSYRPMRAHLQRANLKGVVDPVLTHRIPA
jgi:class 3 adenylate cyclase